MKRSVLSRLAMAGARPGLAATMLPLGTSAHADAPTAGRYPVKPVVVKVAYPPGGPADVSIRVAAATFQRHIGQPMVAENLPGAIGSISAMNVLNAAPDGYTLLGTTGMDFLVAPLTIATARYKPTDFRLVAVMGISDFVLVSSGKHAFRNVDELLARAADRSREPLTIAHWGSGSAPHIVAADFQSRAQVSLVEVPYKGAAPATADVSGGQVDLTFVPLGGATLGMIQAGKLRPIGIASDKRNPALPDLPTLGESPRLRGFEYSLWSAVLAPPRTPDAVVARLNAAITEWLDSADNLGRRNAAASRMMDSMTPEQAQAFLVAEHDKITRVARSLKLAPQ